MGKTFNIYCDESCHLENDHKQYMVLGSVSSAYNQIKLHTQKVKDIKKKHKYYGEIKWTKVSESKKEFYLELVKYFFATDLSYRAVVVDKSNYKREVNSSFDEFYYKMYYQMLNYNKRSDYNYNVYLDIKDTLSAYKVKKLKEILNVNYGVFNNVQNIRSHESLLLQLADLITGAISYNLNDSKKAVDAKVQIINKIMDDSHQKLNKSSYLSDSKLNLFFINLR